MRRAIWSRNGTSSAKIAPVAGALKIAATPAAAPATSNVRWSAPRNAAGRRRWIMAPRADPPYIDGPSRPIGPPMPSVVTAAAIRPMNARGRSGYSGSWNARRYSSDVADDAPLPRARRRIADRARPAPGATAPTHSDPSITRSYANSTTTYSKNRTTSPVIDPVIAANSTTSRERRTRSRNSSLRMSNDGGRQPIIILRSDTTAQCRRRRPPQPVS